MTFTQDITAIFISVITFIGCLWTISKMHFDHEVRLKLLEANDRSKNEELKLIDQKLEKILESVNDLKIKMASNYSRNKFDHNKQEEK